MPAGGAVTVNYTAWDTAAGQGRTGDAANHNLSVVADGGASAATVNDPQEIGGGLYRITLTAAENAGEFLTVFGVSATTGVRIIPARWQNDDADLSVEMNEIQGTTCGAGSGIGGET